MVDLTERQEKWFASVKAGLERDTGKTLDQWVAIAKTCPESKQRAQLAWFKATHGLGQNRAMQVLNAAFPSDEPGWDEPVALRAALWKDPASLAILDAVEARIVALPDVISGQRKGFSAWSRAFQFAALKPAKGGHALLGLAVSPDSDPRLLPAKKEVWSERLLSVVPLTTPDDANSLDVLLKSAWERS